MAVYCLVTGEASPFLAVKVNVAGMCYETTLSVSHSSTYMNYDVLMNDIKRPEENHEETSMGHGILDLPITQAENP